jgi:hypothetical protein
MISNKRSIPTTSKQSPPKRQAEGNRSKCGFCGLFTMEDNKMFFDIKAYAWRCVGSCPVAEEESPLTVILDSSDSDHESTMVALLREQIAILKEQKELAEIDSQQCRDRCRAAERRALELEKENAALLSRIEELSPTPPPTLKKKKLVHFTADSQ